MVFEVECNGSSHRILHKNGCWVLLDHDPRRERLAVELGARTPTCLRLLELIRSDLRPDDVEEELGDLGIPDDLRASLMAHVKRAHDLRMARAKAAMIDFRASRIGTYPFHDMFSARRLLVLKSRLWRLYGREFLSWREVDVYTTQIPGVELYCSRDGLRLLVPVHLIFSLSPPAITVRGDRLIVHLEQDHVIGPLPERPPVVPVKLKEEVRR